ncbi:MAG: two-component sensor histidine kinase [Micromonosporaceae bacterium]|nr:two-component sensor histidine kinase [Micromonosporaceae bacterium]
MTVPAVLAPLVRGSTYRRGVHLLLGGVILLPYLLLGVAFGSLLRSGSSPAVTLVLLAVTAVIAVVPAFLSATRTLEVVAARSLLAVDLPDPAPGPVARETRLRGALWFAIHLVVGGAVGLAILVALPMALVFIVARLGIGTEPLAGFRIGPLDEHDTGWLSLIGVALLVALGYAVAGLGALAATMAPVLLGPSPAERIAALEAQAGQLAERNRLARELHDSVGHALTVTTLQAAAAREVLGSDPAFVARALRVVEETGRTAMADLDHVLGLLRDGERAGVAPPRTLADLARLVADARAADTEVELAVTVEPEEVPPVVSREAYRIVQECLTNAVRHAAGAPVTVRVAADGDRLEIVATNPLPGAGGGTGGGGRGLAGVRERVAALGGRMTAGPDRTAGPDGAVWRVAVTLPVGTRRVRGAVAP